MIGFLYARIYFNTNEKDIKFVGMLFGIIIPKKKTRL